MTWRYAFDNFKYHGMITILYNNEPVTQVFCLTIKEDFHDGKDFEGVRFLEDRSVGKFIRQHQRDQPSMSVLIKLGLIPGVQDEGRQM